MAQTWIDSGVEIVFPDSMAVAPHDRSPGDGNRVWPGVDLRVQDGDAEVWLEVKNFSLAHIPSHRRGGASRSFVCQAKSARLAMDLRDKFVGTSAFLAWTGRFGGCRTTYVVLLEPPRPVDAALMLAVQHRLHALVPSVQGSIARVRVAVIGVAEWNQRYPDFPARAV